MPRYDLTNLTNLQNETSATNSLNGNNATIEGAFDDMLSRVHSSNNAMDVDLDMNSNRVINLPEPVASTEPVRKAEFDTLVESLEDVATGAALWFTQDGTGPSLRTYQDKLRDSAISVKDFGATGDGTTNDRAAIQAAYTAAIALKKNLFFPAGDYRITSALVFDSNQYIEIYGEGMYNSNIVVDGASIGLNIALTSLTAGSFNMVIRDLSVIEATGSTTAGTGTIGIYVAYRGGLELTRVRVGQRGGSGSFDYGVNFHYSCPSMRLYGVYISKCYAYGVRAGHTLTPSADWSAHNAVIKGCTFVLNGLALSGGGLYLRAAIDAVIAENDATDNYVHFHFDACTSVKLFGNHLENDPSSISPSVLVLAPLKFGTDYCSGFTIENNLLGRSPSWTISNLRNSVIVRNHMLDTGTITFDSTCIDVDFKYNNDDLVLTTAVTRTPWNSPSLLNSWASLGSGWAPVGYRLKGDGQLELRGKASGGAAGTIIFNLPAGYRPEYSVQIACAAGGTITIDNGGNVTVSVRDSSNQITLDGVVLTIT